MKTIREAAEEFGVTTRTIRYYEELGMLKPERTNSNKRLFSNAEIAKLKAHRPGQEIRFHIRGDQGNGAVVRC